MNKINFFSSFTKISDNSYLSWKKYAKNIFNITHHSSLNNDLIDLYCKPIQKYNKCTYLIFDIINICKKYHEKFVLLNSDIEIKENLYLWNKILSLSDNNLVIGHRYNYTSSYEDGKLNNNGIDFFIIPNHLFVPNNHKFAIGLCYWDWWIPYLAIQQNITIYRITSPFLYHKIHPRNWSAESFVDMQKHYFESTGYDHSYKQQIIDSGFEI